MNGSPAVVAVTLVVIALVAVVLPLLRSGRTRRLFGTPADRATYATLHAASQAAPPLRAGLTAAGAAKAVRHLRALLGTPAVALTDTGQLLAWDGSGDHHGAATVRHGGDVLADGRTHVVGPGSVGCPDPDCPIRVAVVAPESRTAPASTS